MLFLERTCPMKPRRSLLKKDSSNLTLQQKNAPYKRPPMGSPLPPSKPPPIQKQPYVTTFSPSPNLNMEFKENSYKMYAVFVIYVIYLSVIYYLG